MQRELLAKIAHMAVREAVADGALPDLQASHVACVDCGARATAYDHRDYERPLDVQPVCASCNWHRGPAAPYPAGPKKTNVQRWNGLESPPRGWAPFEHRCNVMPPAEEFHAVPPPTDRAEFFKRHEPWAD